MKIKEKFLEKNCKSVVEILDLWSLFKFKFLVKL